MKRAGVDFGREVDQAIHFGSRRADFIVANQVVVEIKALTALEDIHIAQVKNYLVAYKFRRGLLLNFGARSLEIKRIFNNRA